MDIQINEKAVKDVTKVNEYVFVMRPDVTENWIARVPLANGQALIAFPKFGTVGIGFEKETDWNTNLPVTCSATTIYDHIKHNKGSRKITEEECLAAIEELRRIGCEYLKKPYTAGK
jgi:hypothetical protein